MDITEAIQNQIGGKPKFQASDLANTTKQKLARKRQRETLKFVQKQADAAGKQGQPGPSQ